MLPARICSFPRRNPNSSAIEDSPSTTRMAPFSTRLTHSAEPAEPAGSTKTRVPGEAVRAFRPIEPRICGHEPGVSESTVK